VAQVAIHQGRDVYAFTRPGDETAQILPARSAAAGLMAQTGALLSNSMPR